MQGSAKTIDAAGCGRQEQQEEVMCWQALPQNYKKYLLDPRFDVQDSAKVADV